MKDYFYFQFNFTLKFGCMKKEIIKGTLFGILLPFLFVAFLYLIFYLFEKRITDQVVGSGLLFGLGLNTLLLRRCFKRDQDFMARGVMISSFIYFFIWLYKYVL